MISVSYASIPSFLHGSAFYKNLGDDPEGEISIPLECFKGDDSITTIAELEQILHVDRYWGLNPLPFNMLDYCCKMEKSRQQRTAILALSNQFPTLLEIRTIFSDETPLLKAIRSIARNEIIDFLISTTIDTKGTACSAAARLGQMHHLQSLYINGHLWDESTCTAAAYGGHFDCLVYAHENGCPWDYLTYKRAAIGGYLDCIQYAHKWDSNGTQYQHVFQQCITNYRVCNTC